MLRVRPIHFTSRLDQWERLLTDLGLVRTVDDGPWKEYDAGSGRLALHAAEAGSAEDGTTAFGVEVGDLAEFARRTNQAGAEDGTSPAELTTADHGDTCRITGGDGFSFFADKAAHGAAERGRRSGARRRRSLVHSRTPRPPHRPCATWAPGSGRSRMTTKPRTSPQRTAAC